MKTLDRWLLNPVPRGATYRKWDNFSLSPRILYAHQLFYVFSGSGEGVINGERFPLEPGLLVIYGPGCVHEFISQNQGGLEMGMICFSLNEEDENKRALGNRYVTEINDAYWKLADEPVRIDGLPEFPIRIKLNKFSWRIDFENNLRKTGDAWRRHFTPPLVYSVKSILSNLFYNLENELNGASMMPGPPILQKIIDYISANYATYISRHSVAAYFHISESYLTFLLIKYAGMNFTSLLEDCRLKAALEFVQYSELPMTEIAEKCGFSSVSYFITRFRKKYGTTPGKGLKG